ncbi:sarcosine oxidase subunit delta [Ensifer soli]|uniref:sarcosine oxidase subunit delta n=1 Tax=Ciceribacter sp. sgz301302 TaxID=3342379 RepID=UPI0035B7B3D8
MASLISCPHCGPRPKEEFGIRGAAVLRPAADAAPEDWFAYVYLRDNPRGRLAEYWHHASGCRRWLVVERDTATHEIHSVRDAAARGDAA